MYCTNCAAASPRWTGTWRPPRAPCGGVPTRRAGWTWRSSSLLDQTSPEGRFAALGTAVELYAGDLLDGCYDEWLLPERERLRQRYLDALHELAELCQTRGEYPAAIGHAERLLRADPLREDACRLLMRAYQSQGDHARALRAHHVCASTLERELGVAPSAETRTAYESLLPVEPAAEQPRLGPPLGRARAGADPADRELAGRGRGALPAAAGHRRWELLRPYSAGVYANFLSDENPADVRASYGGRLARLTALKDRLDPTNFFRLNANIPLSGSDSR